MLKQKSIKKIKNSQNLAKIKAQNNHFRKQKEKYERVQLIKNNYRRYNSIVITEESLNHAYGKFVVSMAIRLSGNDFITEYPIKGAEIDVASISLSLLVEIQHNGSQENQQKKKLDKVRYLIDSGLFNDIIILDLEKDFSGNLNEDIKKIKQRLGL